MNKLFIQWLVFSSFTPEKSPEVPFLHDEFHCCLHRQNTVNISNTKVCQNPSIYCHKIFNTRITYNSMNKSEVLTLCY